ncbi:MAG: hypothetical protein H0T73_16430 [Ardenticatenales bacterium]|nr:hypothetical protein [Ardenticatenales bacterium]
MKIKLYCSRALLFGLLLLLLVGGCSSSETPPPVLPSSTVTSAAVPTAIPAQTIPAEVIAGGEEEPDAPSSGAVPGATLSSQSGQSQRAATGSSCWGGPEAPVCADTFALLVPTEPLLLSPGEPLTFTLEAGAPSFVTMRVLAWQPTGDAAAEGMTAIDVAASLLSEGDLEPAALISWEAPPEPGEYVLDLNSVYDNGNSIAYAWHLVVR